MDVSSLRGRIVSGVFWLTATKAIGQAITWAITIVVVRLLSPEDYGLMGMAVLFMGFLLLFNEVGLGAAIVQERELDEERISNLRWAILLVNSGLCAVVFICAPIVARYFDEPDVAAILRVLGTTFVITGIGTPSMYMLQRAMAFRQKSQAEVIGSLAGGALTLAAAAAGFGVWSLVGGYLAGQFTTNALYCVYCPMRMRRSFSLRNIKGMMRFGLQIASARFFWYASANADSVIVGKVLGTVSLGYYSLAFQFSSLPIDKVVGIVTQVAFPTFAALQNEPETLKRYYLKLVSTVALVTFPMFLGLYAVADDAVGVLLTSRWTPVVLPLKILCIAACLRAVDAMNPMLLLAKGRAGIVLSNNLLRAIVMPIAFYAGATYGLEGVAIAWLLAWPIMFAVLTWQTLQLVGVTVPSYFGGLKHAVIGSALMVVTVSTARPLLLGDAPSIRGLAASCVLGALAYLAYNATFNRRVMSEPLGMGFRAVGRLRSSRTAAGFEWAAPLIVRIKSWSGRAGF